MTEEELISKKQLLELTGISYGQLYRWKRKKLVPDEWFIRKSTFTGQETFFPKERMLERVEKIKNMKGDMSLDEIAGQVSIFPTEIQLSQQEILDSNIVSKVALSLYLQQKGPLESFEFQPLLFTYLIDQVLETGRVSSDEAKMILDTLFTYYDEMQGKNVEIIFIRKYGMGCCLLRSLPSELYIDKETKVILRLSVATMIEQLKTKLLEER
ncbi:putative DNA-binding transcriptional regulator AlpA [Pullulanibacillus pueri]|uniref:DUF4004 family protein n=1 Tax=Pullulanibacillus pueri TaxID=1437324 RepID=A0A8J2ZTC9_9BACL|nr:YhbD family protein [Pullulanibacillus pueri]MBM7680351.1 putative DNA-binding transcriptional regulator AlpA [Pullulanibacillus pueri]GGH75508.1 hypothetical protein GCM10007096_04810 [Pullulanibacillus pueri]